MQNKSKKGEIEKLVIQLLEQGVIERAQSPWNSPILIIQKENEEYRFVIDLRAVNRLTKKGSIPVHTSPNEPHKFASSLSRGDEFDAEKPKLTACLLFHRLYHSI